MRPVFVREIKELATPAILLVAAAAIAGASATGSLSRWLEDLVLFVGVGGLALGCLQGVLDRLHGSDLFALHRPVPAGRMELARTLAGTAVATSGLLALAIAHRISTEWDLANLLRHGLARATGIPRQHLTYLTDPWALEHIGGREALLLGALLLGGWSVARFAVGSMRPRWATAATAVLPVAAWSFVARAEAAAALALALAALFSLASWLCLVGDRR